MAVTTESPRQSDKVDDLAASAAEEMLGPNPFVGLRPCDIVATAQQIGAQALRQPGLVMEQEAALARELFGLFSGNAESTPPKGDKRFTDAAWQSNSLYRMTLPLPRVAQCACGFASSGLGSWIPPTRSVRGS